MILSPPSHKLTWTIKLGIVSLILILSSAHPSKIFAQKVRIEHNKLKVINQKLTALNLDQKKSYSKKKILLSDLKNIDIRISLLSKERYQQEQSIQEKERFIQEAQIEQNTLKEQFTLNERKLSSYLLMHYQLKKSQPLALLLNQRDPSLTNRLMSYIAYINKNRTDLLGKITKTSQKLKKQKEEETQQIISLQSLIAQQKETQKLLTQEQKLQLDIIKSLSLQINSRERHINKLNKNRSQLQFILEKIARLKQIEADKIPFYSLKHKLPWPTAGKLSIHNNSQNSTFFTNGVYIKAKEGRQVNAVRSGKVVFSDWLRTYGLLIIIQHDQGFMTLYANNQALYKNKGELVYTGEKIATVGHSGGQLTDGLYFEIRKNGKPLSPTSWLNKPV